MSSFECNLTSDRTLYIIPRGCRDVREVISVVQSGNDTRVAVYFPNNAYQVITDDILRERKMDLQKYIEQTESWRK